MTRRSRGNHSPAFEEKVDLAALKGDARRALRLASEPDHPVEVAAACGWRGGLLLGQHAEAGRTEPVGAARQVRPAGFGDRIFAFALGKLDGPSGGR